MSAPRWMQRRRLKWGGAVGPSLAPWVVVLLSPAVAACGGESASERLDEIASQAERPLDRLQASINRASPRRRSSLVALRASADRVASQLDDVQDELADLEPEDDAERRSVGELDDAIDSVRELAEALARPRLSADQLEGLATESSEAIDDLDETHLPDVDVGSLVAALRRQQRRRGTEGPAVAAPPTASPAVPRPDFAQHAAFGYQARIPSGPGWSGPSDSQPTPGRLFRTSVRGPGGMFLIIDYTPAERATFGGRYESREEVGQTAFGSATKYVFQGGRLPECQRARCVDYIINDPASAQGFAVLAGGPDFALASEIARTVAESVTTAPGE